MGLRAILAAATDKAFIAFDDVPETAILTIETSVHDPATATNVKSKVAHPIQKLALIRFSRDEVGAPLEGQRGALLSNRTIIETGDMKGIVRFNELPTNVGPSIKDTVTADGRVWRIEAVKKDPAEIIWIMHLRSN